jgi:phosphatidylglycerol lysyltransferase
VEPGVLSATWEVTGAYLRGNSALISTQTLCETLPSLAAPSELVPDRARRRIDLPDRSSNEPVSFPASPDSAAQLEELAYRYGRSYESYLVTEPDRECFWLPDRRGAVAFLRQGRYLHVGGGLLAAPGAWSLLLKSFVAWARSQRLRMLFYNIDPQQLPHFRDAGFQATKWGEEPILDLDDVTWQGGQYEWVRRQNNYALRHCLEFRECKPDSLSADEWDRIAAEVEAISIGTKAERPQARDIGFLNGRFDPADLGRRRLFLAHNTKRSRIEGFLLCNPCLGGTEWALELYRDHSDAVRGTIPFLMYQALRQFQQEGANRASLCLVAACRCDGKLPGDSAIIRHALSMSRYFGFIFDVAGMYHFKSRFRPRFEDRFICACPAMTLGAAVSFVRVCGALRLDAVKLGRSFWKQLTNVRVRSTLAHPE